MRRGLASSYEEMEFSFDGSDLDDSRKFMVITSRDHAYRKKIPAAVYQNQLNERLAISGGELITCRYNLYYNIY